MFIDPRTVGGKGLLNWLEDKLEGKRHTLEKHDKEFGETQYLRGQIKGLRTVVDLINQEETDESTG